MSKAEEIAAKSKRLEDMSQSKEGTVSRVEKVRVKPVRITADLPPVMHSDLVMWCANTAITIGRPRIHGQEVVRTLIARLLVNPELGQEIADELRRSGRI